MALGDVRGSVTIGGSLVVPPNPNEIPPTKVTLLARKVSTANDKNTEQTTLNKK